MSEPMSVPMSVLVNVPMSASLSVPQVIRHVLEAIQNLPPELREIIYKEYVAIKLREREALGWTKAHKLILKMPFCHFMQQIVPTVIFLEYPFTPRYDGGCYPCWKRDGGLLPSHKVAMNPPIEKLVKDLIEVDHKTFIIACFWDGRDWKEVGFYAAVHETLINDFEEGMCVTALDRIDYFEECRCVTDCA